MDILYEKQIGENLKNIRLKAGLTQEELASEAQLLGCDLTRSALAKIEVGQRHLYPDEIKILKEVLRTTFDEIFYGECI